MAFHSFVHSVLESFTGKERNKIHESSNSGGTKMEPDEELRDVMRIAGLLTGYGMKNNSRLMVHAPQRIASEDRVTELDERLKKEVEIRAAICAYLGVEVFESSVYLPKTPPYVVVKTRKAVRRVGNSRKA